MIAQIQNGELQLLRLRLNVVQQLSPGVTVVLNDYIRAIPDRGEPYPQLVAELTNDKFLPLIDFTPAHVESHWQALAISQQLAIAFGTPLFEHVFGDGKTPVPHE